MNYKPQHVVRVVTAGALFDGHDATINIIRRILQDAGAEVIHLGHNRSVYDVVKTALQEGAQGICVSSYQGGHMEYFKYMKDLLVQCGAPYVKLFGGGGGVIIHEEKKALEAYGIDQIFHPDDGRRLGLEGMIEIIMKLCDFELVNKYDPTVLAKAITDTDHIPSRNLGIALTAIEAGKKIQPADFKLESFLAKPGKAPLVIGITGTGGAGKSSLIDELILRFLNFFPNIKVGIVCVDPSKRKTGGGLLGDRIRMNSLSRERVFMRSLASRGSGKEISQSLPDIIQFCKTLDFDLIIAETSGIGQGNVAITEVSDLSLYVMTSEFGAQTQLEKIDMIDFADFVAINKSDRRGSHDALRDVSKQYRRSRKIFDTNVAVPVFLTQASRFSDGGVNLLFKNIVNKLQEKHQELQAKFTEKHQEANSQTTQATQTTTQKTIQKSSAAQELWSLHDDAHMLSAEEHVIIPNDRQNYLAEIVNTIHKYKTRTEQLAENASRIGAILKVKDVLKVANEQAEHCIEHLKKDFTEEEWSSLESWQSLIEKYQQDDFIFQVRGKEVKQRLFKESLSGLKIRKVVPPTFKDWGDRFRYLKLENVPGGFPYTAGVFPLRREDEEPKRMFAGEGGPDRTNKRFHYLCKGEKAHRLSTAFDSVTLYGQDPDLRPDIFGKVGESGVSICTLDDMKKLYAGFDLCAPSTSVSMTINGPAPMMLAFYFNTAIDQQVDIKEKELGRKVTKEEYQQLKEWTMQKVRGTVQADILKEDQGQNTCIFSIQFALKMMGDIQEYFVQKKIRNFYSVSISGYHIAEAGANPISQLAFTLSNGFTFVEYYLSRGLKIDDFAPNLSFFFSNGLDPEYTVLGRVARRIWAIAIKYLYNGNEISQKLKYHIQTSGRSLHAQEIDFNDIRTTLQALIALFDNCNSLHTNAYDEAITTPTEESVRRAMAIQMIINREFGMMKNENALQGSYLLEELTSLVEEAVLGEFMRLNERGGVLGAMETQYQRSKIQEESLHYEHLKHTGEFPIIGVNTFINPKTLDPSYVPPKIELARASFDEKKAQLDSCNQFQVEHKTEGEKALQHLQEVAMKGENIFEALLAASRQCSLFQMSKALYEVGGQYRRNV